MRKFCFIARNADRPRRPFAGCARGGTQSSPPPLPLWPPLSSPGSGALEPPLSSPGSGVTRRPPLSSPGSTASVSPPLSSPGSGVPPSPPLSSSGSKDGDELGDDVGDVGDGDAVRLSRGVAVAVGPVLGTAAVTPCGAAGVPVAESSGRRTVLALPVVPVEELLRVWVLTARAVDPVTRIPAIERAKAVLVLMPQL